MWVKIDDGFATHPKILAAGPLAAIIQIRAICFSSQNKTDGFIHNSALPLLLTGFEHIGIDEGSIGDYASFGCQANEVNWPMFMVEHKLWEQAENGYIIHDYLEWNLSKHDIESVSKQRSRAGKKGMKSRYSKEKSVLTSVITNDVTKPYHAISISTSTSSPHSSSEFEQFWAAYPRKVGKKDALKAWGQAKDKPSLDDILKAVEKQKVDEQWIKDGGKFIPHPATWLNKGRWSDELMVNGHGSQKAAIPPFPGPEDPIGRNLWRQAYGNPR